MTSTLQVYVWLNIYAIYSLEKEHFKPKLQT